MFFILCQHQMHFFVLFFFKNIYFWGHAMNEKVIKYKEKLVLSENLDCIMPLTLSQTQHWFQSRVWLKNLWYNTGYPVVWTGFHSYPLFPDFKCFSSSVFQTWSKDSELHFKSMNFCGILTLWHYSCPISIKISLPFSSDKKLKSYG